MITKDRLFELQEIYGIDRNIAKALGISTQRVHQLRQKYSIQPVVGLKHDHLTGKKFGKLYVIKYIGMENGKHTWLCKCDCGAEVLRNNTRLIGGTTNTLHCGCMYKYTALKELYRHYKYNAKRRNLSFNLTVEEFGNITRQPCTYCGSLPTQKMFSKGGRGYRSYYRDVHPWIYNGIDRKDNTRGYELDNCVPCCGTCNWLKGSMNSGLFLAHITKIYNYYVSGSILPERLDPPNLNEEELAGARMLYLIYKQQADARGLQFALPFDHFLKITSQDCLYCGSERQQRTQRKVPYIYNGIDRVDNNIGYIKSNSVPCCKVCNRMKKSISIGEFVDHIIKIYNKG